MAKLQSNLRGLKDYLPGTGTVGIHPDRDGLPVGHLYAEVMRVHNRESIPGQTAPG